MVDPELFEGEGAGGEGQPRSQGHLRFQNARHFESGDGPGNEVGGAG